MKVLITLLVFFFIPSYAYAETVNYLNEDDFIAKYDRSSFIKKSGKVDGILFANHGVNEAKRGAVVISLQVEETPTICSHTLKGKKYLLANTDTFDPNYDQIVAGSYRAINQNLTVTATVKQNCQIITISFDR